MSCRNQDKAAKCACCCQGVAAVPPTREEHWGNCKWSDSILILWLGYKQCQEWWEPRGATWPDWAVGRGCQGSLQRRDGQEWYHRSSNWPNWSGVRSGSSRHKHTQHPFSTKGIRMEGVRMEVGKDCQQLIVVGARSETGQVLWTSGTSKCRDITYLSGKNLYLKFPQEKHQSSHDAVRTQNGLFYPDFAF